PPGPRVRNSLINNSCAAGSTNSVAGGLFTVTLPAVADARISVVPLRCASAVAVAEPEAEVGPKLTVTAARLFEAKLMLTPALFWPNGSRACAVNSCVSERPMVANVGEIETLVKTGGGCVTV